MRRRIFWSIMVVALLTTLLLVVAGVVATQRAVVNATRREMQVAAAEVAGLVESSLDRELIRAERLKEAVGRLVTGELAPFLNRLQRAAGSSELEVALVSAGGVVETSSELVRSLSFNVDALRGGEAEFFRAPGGELVLAEPVNLDRIPATVVVVLVRQAPILDVSQQRRTIFVILAAVAVIAAVLARLLSGSLTRRVRPLADAAHQLAGGDLSVRVPPIPEPELTEVGTAFNRMAGQLEESRQREREFILSVGHDLRTPLTTIGGYAEALESGAIADEEVPRVGGVLRAQTGRLRRLIDDLTLLARLGNPEFSLRPEAVDVAAHLKEIAGGYINRADAARVQLITEIDPVGIHQIDPDRLAQVVGNLLENALRYTPEAGRVTLRLVRERDLAISVSDTGPGIEPEDLPHIFERFYVAHRYRKVRPEGSGLGLAIVAGLVDRMGGTVAASSTPGEGTTVTIRIPG
jgi:two-component system sensor histidine kinase BaeS